MAGAAEGGGEGEEEQKFSMRQRTILDSLADFEMMRSLYHATLPRLS